VCVCFGTEGQYSDSLEILDVERGKWEREMTQFAKVSLCLSLSLLLIINDG